MNETEVRIKKILTAGGGFEDAIDEYIEGFTHSLEYATLATMSDAEIVADFEDFCAENI